MSPAPVLALARVLELAQESLPQEGAPAGGEGGAPQGGSFFGGMFGPLILIMVVFYFVLILPERKNRKKREEMLTNIKKGDKVVTTSGLHGSVAQVQDQVVTLQVADGVRLRYSLSAVQAVVESKDGDAKELESK